MNDAVVRELAKGVTPVRLDLEPPFDDLAPLEPRVQSATVVALGSTVRQAYELNRLSHRILRFLVNEQGFRALALEGDEAVSVRLDAYVRNGQGDPRHILAEGRPFLRLAEIAEAVRWIRLHNERHSADPVRVIHSPGGPDRQGSSAATGPDIERRAAEQTISWHERTGDRIVYWGGLHTSKGLLTGRNLGAHLQKRFTRGYVSIGMTFHQGSFPPTSDAPPDDYLEATLGAVERPLFLLDINSQWPECVGTWLDASPKVRLIGPGIHELHGRALVTWLDFIVHSQQVTEARSL